MSDRLFGRIVAEYRFEDEVEIAIPWGEGSRVLHVDVSRQTDTPVAWVEHLWVNELPTTGRGHAVITGERALVLRVTGEPIIADPDARHSHVGTVICEGGRLVWHVYLKGEV